VPAALPPSVLGDSFERAVTFAIASLRNDKRVSSHVAVARLFGVCATVLENGGSENEAIAGLIHSSVDRRAATHQIAFIRSSFGEEVASIVEGCSASVSSAGPVPPRPFYDRTLAYLERLGEYTGALHPPSLAASVFFVSAADTLYEARVVSEELARGGEAFDRREGGKYGTLWSLSALAGTYLAYDAGGPEPAEARHLRLAREIAERVILMAGKPVHTEALRAAFAIDATIAPRDKGMLVPAEGR